MSRSSGAPTAEGVLSLGEREIGPGRPALVVAEVAQAHEGSLRLAHAFIDAAAEAGAEAVKFQTHIAGAESTLDEPFRVAMGGQDATRHAYWRRMEFEPEQWAGLADHARDRGLLFLSSAFSVAAVMLLDQLRVPAWKVGSGEYRSPDLLRAMADTGRPLLLSTGMASLEEIARAVEHIRALAGSPLALFQCTSKYPTPLEEVGLNMIEVLRSRHLCPVGLSDHSGTVWPSLAALARGADMIEIHLTFDRAMGGPDAAASLTPEELRQITRARDAFVVLDSHPVDKDAMARELAPMRALFTKSITPALPLPAGTVLVANMLTLKKPGTGIAAEALPEVLGRRLVRDVFPDRLLRWEDLDA